MLNENKSKEGPMKEVHTQRERSVVLSVRDISVEDGTDS